MKEPDPILPKPALPYESSSDDDGDKTHKSPDKSPEKPEEKPPAEEQTLKVIPPVLVYKMDGQLAQNLPKVKAIEPLKYLTKSIVQQQRAVEKILEKSIEEPKTIEVIDMKPATIEVKNDGVQNFEKMNVVEIEVKVEPPIKIVTREPSPIIERKAEKRDSARDIPDKRREKKRHKVYRSKSAVGEYKRSKSSDREKRRERDREREKKRPKIDIDNLESEIISLEDNSDDMIDLTGDQSDSRGKIFVQIFFDYSDH